MATKLQSAAGGVSASDTAIISFGSGTTAGSLVVVNVGTVNGADFTATDNATPANAYTKQISRVNAVPQRTGILSADNITAKASPHSVTVTSTGATVIDVGIHEWSGMTSPGIDKTAGNDQVFTTTWDGGTTAATSQANEMVSASMYTNASPAIGYTAPATKVTDRVNINGDRFTDGYNVVAAAGTQTIAGTIGDAGETWCAVTATFLAGATTPYVSAGSGFQKSHHPAPFKPGNAR